MMGKTILVTGGAGFIGSHYVRLLLETYPDVQVINADALTYSANLFSLADVENNPRYRFYQVDLAEAAQVAALFEQPIDEVVHFAAESHVDRSIQGADPFIRSNIIGTYNLMHASMKKGVTKYVQISTDEVYGSVPQGRVNESTPLAPGNPYSASKASADLLCLSYFNTFDFPVVITRCTNNYGPNQHPEKLIPRLIERIEQNQTVPIYGNGQQERDWLHVVDHCKGIDLVRLHGKLGQVYHIGAENTVPNLEVAKAVLQLMDQPLTMIEHVQDRLGHDARYSLDTTKIRTELGWLPTISFADGIKETVAWYLSNKEWWGFVKKEVI